MAVTKTHPIKSTLKALELSDYRERHPASLSGGQKQRVTIGAAIVKGSPVIYFDAVSYTHLDVYKRQVLHRVPGMLSADHKKFVFLRAKSKTVPL